MHEPVLLQETLDLLGVKPGGVYVDGTVGSGGHAAAILARSEPGGVLIGVDRDVEALGRAAARLASCGAGRVVLRHGNFAQLGRIVAEAGRGQVDGVLLDVGLSSEQVEDPARGFSFLGDGPLDMRMDRSDGITAADLVNGLTERELTRILRDMGEERLAGRIAGAVVRARRRAPISTTLALAGLVEEATGGRQGRLHPATRTFQALRMAVNRELECLAAGLREGLGLLAPGGRMAVISFHSLEDRQVKRFFACHAGRWVSLPQGGRARQGEDPAVRLVTRKPATPSEGEIGLNPRARSAKLRVAERVEGGASAEAAA
jgi:16S rRNA (cytosine1402-N4)-methyltransferase